MVNPWGQEGSFYREIPATILTLFWQTFWSVLLVEIFQKVDYWFHSASPSGKEGLSQEGGGKWKVVTARAGDVCLGQGVKRMKRYHITDALLCWGCMYVSLRTQKKYTHTSAELPNSLPSHAELSTVSSNSSQAASNSACQNHKFVVTDCRFCRNLSKGLAG